MANMFDAAAYLDRIGLAEPIEHDIVSLQRLQHAHLLRIPFENLDIHLGRSIRLDIGDLFQKIVVHRRGGFCYELNGLFASLLKTLGFEVTLLSARVANWEGTFGPEFDHLALRVDLDQPYLVDVGFGDAFVKPLRLVAEVEQTDRPKRFQLFRQGRDWSIQARLADQPFEPLYLFTTIPRSLDDFAEMCRYHQTSPASHFTHGTICSIATPSGRLTISDNRFIESRDGHRVERQIKDETELRRLLADHFGVVDIDASLLFQRK
jgi:N-hydroxyarylamine O-acetyltransferase